MVWTKECRRANSALPNAEREGPPAEARSAKAGRTPAAPKREADVEGGLTLLLLCRFAALDGELRFQVRDAALEVLQELPQFGELLEHG